MSLKARVGKYIVNGERRFKLEFKKADSIRYFGISIDIFDTKVKANKALEEHNQGKRVYTIFAKNSNGNFLCKIKE